MRGLSLGMTFIAVMALSFALHADSVGFYFNYSNQLIDLPYPGDTFYGNVYLDLPEANHLSVCVNAFSAPGEDDCIGNYISSPLVEGESFGIQQFALDSTLITTETDFDNFLALYDIVLPHHWICKFNGQVSEFGRFEFLYSGPGSVRVDPLSVTISPKPGEDLTGYEFDSVFAFVEENQAGYCFAAHIAGFTTDPAYWDNGYTDIVSAYFAVGECPTGELPEVIPEPTSVVMVLFAVLGLIVKRDLS